MFISVRLSFVVLLSAAGAATVERMQYDHYKYHPLTEITSWMEQLVKDYPDVVTMVIYGKTYEKRDISMLKIGLNTGKEKKAIWMDCGIHAREWIAPAFCQYFVKQILETYKTDAKMEEMMKNVDFYVTPVLNIDGYIYTWKNETTRLWRKNRSPGPENCSCYGTDLNRNFDANWGTVGVSHNCCSKFYPGSKATSELEIKAVTDFVGSRKDSFLCFLNIHSYGQMLLIPYGHPNYTAPNYDELMTVGVGATEAMWKVHRTNYTVGTPPDILYPITGSATDWARMQGIPLTYTFELRDNGTYRFELPEDQIQPTCEEVYRGVLYIITYAHDTTFNGAVASSAVNLSGILLAAGVTGATLT